MDGLLTKDSRGGTTTLASVEEETEVRRLDCLVEVRILAHYHGRLPAELQCDSLHIGLRSHLDDFVAHRR